MNLFKKLIDLVLFGPINKVVDKAIEDAKKVDPESKQSMVKTIDNAQRSIDKANAALEEYCKKYPHKQICKDYKKNGPRTLDMKW